jgi:diketogulonate reductase-like aldo/keto reductase
MHYPVTETRLKAWKEMEKIYESGRARSIGVSNFTIKHLKELMKSCNVVPAVNQVEFHPFLFQKELMDFCHKNNIALEAYSPLVHGKKMFVPTITEIAQSHLKTDAQVMLRWNVQHGNIVIPKSKTPSRIQENFNIFDFKLTDEEMATIDGLNENLRTCWDPTDMP